MAQAFSLCELYQVPKGCFSNVASVRIPACGNEAIKSCRAVAIAANFRLILASMVRRWLSCGLLLALATGAWAANPQKEASEKPTAVLTGRLARQGGTPVLKAKDKTYRLVSSDEYASAVLGDKRILGWELHVEGQWKDKDTFQVDRLFSLRDGQLYKVTYFCHVCNITSYKPGRCDCCQDLTEVREVPDDPEGIY